MCPERVLFSFFGKQCVAVSVSCRIRVACCVLVPMLLSLEPLKFTYKTFNVQGLIDTSFECAGAKTCNDGSSFYFFFFGRDWIPFMQLTTSFFVCSCIFFRFSQRKLGFLPLKIFIIFYINLFCCLLFSCHDLYGSSRIDVFRLRVWYGFDCNL